MGEPADDEESAFISWLCFHQPELLSDIGRERFIDSVPAEDLEGIKCLSKPEFFQALKYIRLRRGY